MAGRLIVVEGLDGSGKSTQLQLLHADLQQQGLPARVVKLPNYDDPACEPVKMYLGGRFGDDPDAVNAYAAATFYAVDRYVSYQCYWKQGYLGGETILADRYTTSNAYHQTIKLPRKEWPGFLDWLADFEYGKLGIPKPDMVLYLDMPIAVSQTLLRERYGGDDAKKDIHERNTAYLERCREAALFAADRLGWTHIPCAQNGKPRTIDDIQAQLRTIVKKEMSPDA